MAASDQTYRSQSALDIVFGVTSLLMLISIVWMFVQDYNREFKTEQRSFRDFESAVAERVALEQIPSEEEFKKAEDAVEREKAKRKDSEATINDLKNEMYSLLPEKELTAKKFQDVRAVYDSKMSLYNIAVERNPKGPASEEAKTLYAEVDRLNSESIAAKAASDKVVERLKAIQRQLDSLENPLVEAQSAWKKVNDKFETQARLAISKRWGFGDWLRSQPVIDGFASPLKIQQYTINDIPIDFNFKHVTRFDRCTSCHLGIDRPAYTKERLRSLTEASADQKDKLKQARARLEERKKVLAGTGDARNIPDPNELTLTEISKDKRFDSRVSEFCAHPRLELFVGANSKHPAEKFGCTSCHAGQGSGTSFSLSSHSPNDAAQKKQWVKEHDWESNHMWDFPMLPMRFIESSCLKCHYEVTDLYTVNNRNEAPKLTRGYNLIKDNGCFGCHEIQGRKGGRQVGPDLRLESKPPLEDLPPLEQARVKADVENMPGNLRKVGPSLYRLAEKTNKEWTARWINAPREFRPDTKMPHYYGLANNNKSVLPDEQKEFPDAEIQSITHFLFDASNNYLKQVTQRHDLDKKNPAEAAQDNARLDELRRKSKLDAKEKTEFDDVQARVNLRKAHLLVDLAPKYKGDAAKGRLLFTERGCLACHSHEGTETAQGVPADLTYAPPITSEAQFGPNLSQLVDKLGKTRGDTASARIWLMQWIKDPHVHSPRSRMPVTHLDNDQVADVAEWLLSQKATDLGSKWGENVVVEPREEDLKKLAEVYLVRLLPRDTMGDLLANKKVPPDMIKELPAEEQELAAGITSDSLKRYLGKKAVNRLGCFGCHDIPGFDSAKSIGVGLNDWGKKDAERLAFEDIAAYVKDKYYIADKDAKPVSASEATDKKKPYEQFFAEALLHHSREGFLHQKLQEPRSYDYNRKLAWDDRARMPQFQFARLNKKKDEKDDAFELRSYKEEAGAREAVMTFVLGLVAEPVPTKSINQPSGDRLAEVKGRQVIDKFNCAGCHLIQPGSIEFRLTPASLKKLDIFHRNNTGPARHAFPDHFNWTGRNPELPDRVQAPAAQVRFEVIEDTNKKQLKFRTGHAVQYLSEQGARSVPAGSIVNIPLEDLIAPSPAVAENPDELKRFLKEQGQLGGAFSDLLAIHLVGKDKARSPRIYEFDENQGDSAYARAAGPPILLTQGERTQPEWLYKFLLDPQPVRRMSVLRMPRFNMSTDEADALVAYFGGTERLQNPGIPIPPRPLIPEQQDLDSPYWKAKTAAYVERLKSSKEDGKNLFDQRIAEYTPIWDQVSKDATRELQPKIDETKKRLEPLATRAAEAKKALDDKKKDADLKKLEEAAKQAEQEAAVVSAELKELSATLDDSSTANLKKNWQEKEAYVADAYRLVANRNICLQCHQVGKLLASNRLSEGPPLANAPDRLRPGWTKRWIANPQRFLTYQSVMPDNFPADKKEHQLLFAGDPLEQVIAARDVLMVMPRAEAMPINRYWAAAAATAPTKDKEKEKDKEKDNKGEKK